MSDEFENASDEIQELLLDLSAVTDQRTTLRSRVTRFCNRIASEVDEEQDKDVISDSLSLAEKFQKQLEVTEKKYYNILTQLGKPYVPSLEDKHKSYLEKLDEAHTLLMDRNTELDQNPPQPGVQNNSTTSSSAPAASSVVPLSADQFKQLLDAVTKPEEGPKPPEVPLPSFDPDEKSNFQTFIKELEVFFARYPKIGEDQKFLYLKKHLKKKAFQLVSELPFDQQNYSFARDLLYKAYADPHAEKAAIFKQLADLKYKNSSTEFFGDLNYLLRMVQFHKVTAEEFIGHFAWRALPTNLRSVLVQMTNSSHPTVQQISDKIFDAQRRVEEFRELQEKKFKSSKTSKPAPKKPEKQEKTTSMAAQVKTTAAKKPTTNVPKLASTTGTKPKQSNKPKQTGSKDPFCPLCNKDKVDASHLLSNCKIYTTPEVRVKRLKEIEACTNCGYTSHTTAKCKVKFDNKCPKCQGEHLPHLCLKAAVTKDPEPTTTVGITILKATSGGSLCNSLLPSLDLDIKGNSLRTLLDSGAQANFIKTELVERLNLPILRERVPMCINGVNSNKSYVVKETSAPVKVGNEIVNLRFFTLPEIDLSLQVHGVKELATLYKRLGCNLADSSLLHCENDVVDNFSIIIGINDLDKFKLETAFVGNKVSWEFDDKLILFGNVEELVANAEEVISLVSGEN